MNVIGFVKDHPYMVGAGVFVVGLIVVMSMTGNGDTEVVDLGGYNAASAANAAANTALVQTQTAAQVAARLSDNELAAHYSDNESAVKVASANFEYLSNKDVLTAKVATRALEAQEYTSTLGAQVENNRTEAARSVAMAGIGSQTAIAQMAAAVENNRINTNAAAAIAISNKAAEVQRASDLDQYNFAIRALDTNASQADKNRAFAADLAHAENINLALDREQEDRRMTNEYTLGAYSIASGTALNFASIGAQKSAAKSANTNNLINTGVNALFRIAGK